MSWKARLEKNLLINDLLIKFKNKKKQCKKVIKIELFYII